MLKKRFELCVIAEKILINGSSSSFLAVRRMAHNLLKSSDRLRLEHAEFINRLSASSIKQKEDPGILGAPRVF